MSEDQKGPGGTRNDLLEQNEQALDAIEARCLASPNGELHLHRPEGTFTLKTSIIRVLPVDRLWALLTGREDVIGYVIGYSVEEVFTEAQDDYPDILTWLDQFQEESNGEQEKGEPNT